MSCGVGMITVQEKVYLNAIGNPKTSRLFKTNEQYCYTGTIIKLIGCGCGSSAKKQLKYFQVQVDKRNYEVPETNAFQSTVEIRTDQQDFELLRRTVFFQNKDHQDYSSINHNCINCNQLIPHGDPNNLIDTGGHKDPMITGQ